MLIWIVLTIIGLCFAGVLAVGAPYLRSLKPQRRVALDMMGDIKGLRLADLGSGDGQLLLEAQRRGAVVSGYELNPLLWLLSKIRLRCRGQIYLQNLWKVDCSQFDIVFVFLHPRFMARLDAKLTQENFEGRLVSFAFELPERTAVATKQSIFVYDYSAGSTGSSSSRAASR